MFKGAITAIVTPFQDGAIDYKSFETLIKFKKKEVINGIFPCGTKGEF